MTDENTHAHEESRDGDHSHEKSHSHDTQPGHSHEQSHDHSGEAHAHDDHHHHDADSVAVAVVTVSSSRDVEADPSGEYIVTAFEDAGHEVTVRELVPDEYDSVQGTVDRLARRKDTDVVVTTGGTGVTPDDVTPEAVRGLFAKRLPGFGELFRRLSYEEIGTSTIGSRATAGVILTTPVFCLPGSKNAVRLGVDEIILSEVGHLVGLARRGMSDETDENAENDHDTSAE